MKDELLDILCCPLCSGDLNLTITEGEKSNVRLGNLECKDCHSKYDIFNDIPYFSMKIFHQGIKNQYETYSHWFEEMHDETTMIDASNSQIFTNSLRIKTEECENRVVLDAGCGYGRFSYVVSNYNPKLLVSFDISKGLEKAKGAILKHNPQANIAFVQGDITAPPFKKKAFDVVFSWGVIHHTPNTRKTFETLSSLVKRKGVFGIFVYPFNPLYEYDKQSLGLLAYLRSFLLIRPFRFICSRLPVFIVKLIFQPIYYVERLFGVGVFGCHGPPPDVFNKPRYFRVVVDRFKTRYASEHKLEEVLGWFISTNYNNLRIGHSPKISVSGTKMQSASSIREISLSVESEESK